MRAPQFLSHPRLVPILCSILIVLFFLPALVYGPRKGDDMSFHLVWLASYSEALQHGVWYPRWTPDAISGLGSPVFFFYPPLATLFMVATDAITLHSLADIRVIGLGGFLMAALSGVSFYAWARNFASVRLSAVIATFYVIAPYHMLMNFYNRTALAEYAAFIWIPLIFHALHNAIASNKTRWLALLACSVAGLFLTHLLSAMVAGPVAAAYAIIQLNGTAFPSRKAAQRKLLLVTVAAALGVCMAAFYFVPALMLLKETSSEFLQRRPIEDSWLFQHLFSFENRFFAKLNLFSVTYIALTVYILFEYLRSLRGAGAGFSGRNRTLLFAFVVLFASVLMAGLLPFVFSAHSPYRSLQFAWRLVGIVEFCALTLVAVALAGIAQARARKRILTVCSVLALVFVAYQANSLMVKYSREKIAGYDDFEQFRVLHRMAPPEYYALGAHFPSEDVDLAPRMAKYIAHPDNASVVDGDGKITRADRDFSRFTIQASAATRTTIALHQFYFPGWHASDENGAELAVRPATPDQLASFSIEPGSHTITVERRRLPIEFVGIVVSAAAALLLAILLILTRRTSVVSPRR